MKFFKNLWLKFIESKNEEISKLDNGSYPRYQTFVILNWLSNILITIALGFGFMVLHDTSAWKIFGYSGMPVMFVICSLLLVLGLINFILIYFSKPWKYREKCLYITLGISISIKLTLTIILFTVSLMVMTAQTTEIWTNSWLQIEKTRFTKTELSIILRDELRSRKITGVSKEDRLEILHRVKNPEELKAFVKECIRYTNSKINVKK